MNFLFLEIKDGNDHGTIVISGNSMMFDSTVGGQFFDIPSNYLRERSSEETVEQHIALQFPSRGSLEMSARFFREGFTSKEKFKSSIATLLDKKKITKEEHVRLLNLINSCDCGPEVVRQKVRDMGLGRVLSEEGFDFIDPHHNFTKPIDFLWGWIEKILPKKEKDKVIKVEPENKNSSKRVAAIKAAPKTPSYEEDMENLKQGFQDHMGTTTTGYSDSGVSQETLKKEEDVMKAPDATNLLDAQRYLAQSESRMNLDGLPKEVVSKEEYHAYVDDDKTLKIQVNREVVTAVDHIEVVVDVPKKESKKGRKKKS